MTNALYISLGHNASAAFAMGGNVHRAYEQERLDRRKSSSAYPRLAIEHAMRGYTADVAYVSHWFDDMTLSKRSPYLDVAHLRSVAPEIVTLSNEFTHHDAHASSAIGFLASHRAVREADVVVLDGFGTRQECLSVYSYNHRTAHTLPLLRHRTYGYELSLGLMYQYTTAYLGLKPNQDEYKLLGYESHVLKHVSFARAMAVSNLITAQAITHARLMAKATTMPSPPEHGTLISFDALEKAKHAWTENAARWRRMFTEVDSEAGIRACVAFCAQTFLEECVRELASVFGLGTSSHMAHGRQLILTGGCFMNVKLNRFVQVCTRRQVFSHPLCGDQGAAMGHTPGLQVNTLALGWRKFAARGSAIPNLFVVEQHEWVAHAAKLISQDKIVNVVRGSMEFGPRALCNTSTLALPTRTNVQRINALNNRDESMPMAPVMTRDAAEKLFSAELPHTHVSNEYMITTVAFDQQPPSRLRGVAHRHPLFDTWTARPQVADSSEMTQLLSHTEDGVLINTSFNAHGEPIVYSVTDASLTHYSQLIRAHETGLEPPTTIIVKDMQFRDQE